MRSRARRRARQAGPTEMKLTQEIIAAKRDGAELPEADIRQIIAGISDGGVSEGQAAAFAMASAMYLGSGSVVWPMPREVIWRVGVGSREQLLRHQTPQRGNNAMRFVQPHQVRPIRPVRRQQVTTGGGGPPPGPVIW